MLYDEKQWNDERATWIVGETDSYWIDICPMIFNHRVVMTPKGDPEVYDWCWCYSSMELAQAAVERWNPDMSWVPNPGIHNFRPTEFNKEIAL